MKDQQTKYFDPWLQQYVDVLIIVEKLIEKRNQS
jgi:hypothetical protein